MENSTINGLNAKNAKAKTFFQTLNKTNTFAIGWRLQTAKKPETREKRIKAIIEMLKPENLYKKDGSLVWFAKTRFNERVKRMLKEIKKVVENNSSTLISNYELVEIERKMIENYAKLIKVMKTLQNDLKLDESDEAELNVIKGKLNARISQ